MAGRVGWDGRPRATAGATAGDRPGVGSAEEAHDRKGATVRAAAPSNYRRPVNHADVVVIGGGIAGASVAYELSADRTVLLLEGERALATHSTARSAATFIPGHGAGPVRALVAASGPRFAALAAQLDAPQLLTPREVVWVGFDEPGEAGVTALLAERAGEPFAPQRIDPAVAQRLCPLLRPGVVRAAALTTGSADLDAAGVHAAFVRGLRRRGGEVRSSARVRSVESRGAGWRVHIATDHVDVPDVVDAAGAWADVVAESAGVATIGLVPFRRTAAVVPVADDRLLAGPDGGRQAMVIEVGERFYFKTEPGGLLVSPGDETPSLPCDARPEDVDVAIALERVAAVTTPPLRSVRTAWAGLRSFVADRLPVVGAWPQHPGFHFLAGQGGSGIESSPALAVLAAAAVTGGPVPADIDVDPAVFSPTRLL